MLGTVESPDGRQLVVADVPGLIEGASEGVGLGHEFLAHLERARTLVHVIDASQPIDEQWRTIDAELAAYGAGLDELPQIVVLNKIDLAPDPVVPDRRRARDRRLPRSRARRARGSTSSGAGCSRSCPSRELAGARRGRARRLPRLPARSRRRGRGGCCAPRAASACSARRRRDEELERALRAAGAKDGATVEIGDEEFELA